ncbi:MAG: hypothetical protein QOJ15_7922 [Bradyrhizobium sp.]|jgi:hypothetical protein|nr:hypothetical protein [Bradyrhizobium sp.]
MSSAQVSSFRGARLRAKAESRRIVLWFWIPVLRQEAHPGMTAVKIYLKSCRLDAVPRARKKPGRFSGSGLSLSVNSIAQCVA